MHSSASKGFGIQVQKDKKRGTFQRCSCGTDRGRSPFLIADLITQKRNKGIRIAK